MPKLKLVYIASVVVLAAIVVFTLLRPFVRGGEYSEVRREELVGVEEGWIAQFEVVNREGKEQNYSIVTLIGDRQPYKEEVQLESGKALTFTRLIQLEELGGKTDKVTFEIYKEGQSSPFEQVTYYLK